MRLPRLPRFKLRLSQTLQLGEVQRSLLWAAAVGLVGALASGAFRWLIRATQMVLWQQPDDLIAAAPLIPPWQRLAVPALGGAAAGMVLYYGARFTERRERRASTDFMEAIALGDGTIRMRPSLVKSASSMVTVASGGSIGREGAMVQLSAMLASWLGRHLTISRPRLQLLVACGAAAGIASAYNAPIAGALFVAEIVLGSIKMESLGPLVCASVVATITTQQLLGSGPVFDIPQFHLRSPVELVTYALLGALLGALSQAFVRLLRASERVFLALTPAVTLRFFLGGAIVGALSLVRPEVWGNGQTPISAILGAEWGWQLVLAVLLAKLAATAATVGSGAVGGVFTPSLFLGAAGGYLMGSLVHDLIPGASASPGAYALVGMGAFLAGTTHAPLMAILALFEMTLDYGIVLPLMLACVVAYHTSRALADSSIYSEVLQRKESQAPPTPRAEDTIAPLVKPAPLSVREDAHFAELVQAFVQHPHKYLFVTDAQGHFEGAISLHDIKAYLHDARLADLLIASELVDRSCPVLEQDATLAQALEKVMLHDGERIPVVEDLKRRKLAGTVSKTDLLLTLAMQGRPGTEAAAQAGAGTTRA
jgi:CIC family chloride channel protein